MKRTLALLALAVVGVLAAFLLPRAQRAGAPVAAVTTATPSAPVPLGGGVLTVQARPARRAFLAGGDDLDLVFELTAARGSSERRAPVDFALVFDRSGSMIGEPLAKAKAAAAALVERLSEQDRLALVTFSSDARVAMTAVRMDAHGRADALRLIGRIDADGGTNMSAALAAAEQALNGAGRREGAVRRVVLLSDGQANEGLTGAALVAVARDLGRAGHRISALGLGVDFDEDTMLAIADAGGGQYRYLRNGDEVAAALGTELAQAGATAASAIQLAFEASSGIELREIVGYETGGDDTARSLGIADIAAGETRRVVVRVRASAASSGLRDLVKVRVTYVDVPAGQVARGAQALAQAEATQDRAKVAGSYDADAAKASLRARWGGALSGAARRYESDDVAGASAGLDAMVASIKETAEAIGDTAFAGEFEQGNAAAKSSMDESRTPEAKADSKKTLKNFGNSFARGL